MRHPRVVAAVGLLAAVVLLAACEAESDGGGDAGNASAAAYSGPTVVTPDNQPALVLEEGIYRVEWKTTGCTRIKLAFVGDNGFSKEKTSTLPTQSWIVTGVETGTYQVAQTDESCADWELKVERIGG